MFNPQRRQPDLSYTRPAQDQRARLDEAIGMAAKIREMHAARAAQPLPPQMQPQSQMRPDMAALMQMIAQRQGGQPTPMGGQHMPMPMPQTQAPPLHSTPMPMPMPQGQMPPSQPMPMQGQFAVNGMGPRAGRFMGGPQRMPGLQGFTG